jgi:hypothetical protein
MGRGNHHSIYRSANGSNWGCEARNTMTIDLGKAVLEGKA